MWRQGPRTYSCVSDATLSLDSAGTHAALTQLSEHSVTAVRVAVTYCAAVSVDCRQHCSCPLRTDPAILNVQSQSHPQPQQQQQPRIRLEFATEANKPSFGAASTWLLPEPASLTGKVDDLRLPYVRVLGGGDGAGAQHVPFAAADDSGGLRAMQQAALRSAVRLFVFVVCCCFVVVCSVFISLLLDACVLHQIHFYRAIPCK